MIVTCLVFGIPTAGLLLGAAVSERRARAIAALPQNRRGECPPPRHGANAQAVR